MNNIYGQFDTRTLNGTDWKSKSSKYETETKENEMSHYDENWKDKQGDSSNIDGTDGVHFTGHNMLNNDITEAYDVAKISLPVLDIIGLVDQWNKDAGRTDSYFNVRQAAFYTGMQCEEFGEKLKACGMLGIAHQLEVVGKELKDGHWDFLIRDQAMMEENRKEMLDGDADLMVVTIGAAQGQGAKFKEAMTRVILANEAKRFDDGKLHKSENGKIIKPHGWKAPDLSGCISDTVADK